MQCSSRASNRMLLAFLSCEIDFLIKRQLCLSQLSVRRCLNAAARVICVPLSLVYLSSSLSLVYFPALPHFPSLSPAHWCFFPVGESTCKHIFKIPLCNLVGRSIERPLKSPLVNKVLTAPTPMVPPTPLISATHSLSLSRMEIKEIASRTRKELLGKNSLLYTKKYIYW